METAEIRDRFVDYYRGMGYRLLPRAPLVDSNTSMSFVMSAGLVQVERALASVSRRDHNRFVLVQECYRYFDLEKVGTDDLHMSFFEMPGAFIFGESQQTRAIRCMWQLATLVLGIPPERLWVTCFGGGTILDRSVPEDRLTIQTWRDLGLPPERIIALQPPDNFWLQGTGGMPEQSAQKQVTRRCGPNTELFYDRGAAAKCGPACQPGCRCGRFVEFANSLFITGIQDIQAQKIIGNPDPFTETVIGLERAAMILQNKQSVFEIDTLAPLVTLIRSFVSPDALTEPYSERYIGAIADHLRALFALMRDGAPPPGKDGQERLIKKLIRRTVTLAILLDIHVNDFLDAALDQVLALSVRDENNQRGYEAARTCFQQEERRFLATIEKGQRRLERMLHENQGQALCESQRIDLVKEAGYPGLLIERALLQRNGRQIAESHASKR